MKIGIYNEPSDSGIGGGEFSVAVLAEALGKKHEVEIIHHRTTLTPEQLSELFDVDLTSVRFRYVEYQPETPGNGHSPWALYQAAKSWHSNLSKPYDLFINFGHNVPPFCHSKSGILMVLFPIFDRSTAWPWNIRVWDNTSVLRKCLRLLYNEWEWRKRLKSYRVKLANSHFTKNWVQFRWGVECQVLYPPVDDQFGSTEKRDMVLSVGRFVASGQKQQREMVNTFLRMVEDGQRGWNFFSVGGVSNAPADRAYFENVRRRADGRDVHIKANIERTELRSLYEQAKIFWHAAGYRMKERMHPEMQEHFGISTVEAMAAGCVPVVVKRGGQREIVEHGVSGFLWDTLGELREYTVQLMRDDGLRARMSREARVRSQLFGRKMFVKQFEATLRNSGLTK